jgi:rfaE bifunctional protein kinase chain/domain
MEELINIINSFDKKRILLIGDTILDIYSYGRKVCKSSDSDAVEVEEDKISVSFGGASLVASNILELGGHVIFFSVIGNDEAAKYYDNFNHPKLEKHFLVDGNRSTTIKKRFWVGDKKLFQANFVDNRCIEPATEKKIVQEIKPFIKNIEVIVVLDAHHGLMTKNLIASLVSLAQKYQKPLYVDSQISHRPSNHHLYKGADCLFLNQREANAVNVHSLGVTNFIIKLGDQGSKAWFNNKRIRSKAYPVKAVDPCGAGDAFLAAFSLSNRDAVAESLTVTNTWAALSTTIRGTQPPKKQDLIKIYG